MTINSRNKGSTFERAIARELELLLGIRFERNLEQVRAVDHSDLTPSDPAFPFSLELKRYASGTGCKAEWKAQSQRAAAKTGKIACVIYKFDRQDVWVAVPMAAFGHDCAEWAETTMDGLAYLAREIMAGKAA